ncbi:LytR/AlgR family response regulator transcription factor [Colwellia psychrerythraea]|uniref:Two component transcriptional regulator, LytTR family n=1 Tax=Colwellia psychrerythraea TaxID=28229 RepID=A0A099KWV3_COLPS|nr:response regulator transcription factor [Colwellia psychrerythraea]KGJ95214.1 two component transcriptional regulator, LytTR family [Colwellia psychrerythraea]
MNAIVVEDSRLARNGLVRMLSEFKEIEVAGAAEDVSSALVLIKQHQPEVIFLDIHMPEQNGFELLAKMNYQAKIIFTTAYAEYAVQAFEHNSVDYLLKPISKERLAKAIEKLSNQNLRQDKAEVSGEYEQDNKQINEPILALNSRIFVKDNDQCHLIEIVNIDYIESCKNYVQVYFEQKKVFVKKTLNHVEIRLPKQLFFRVNRQFIINLQSVVTIVETLNDGYDLTMTDGKTIEISRRNTVKLKALLSL